MTERPSSGWSSSSESSSSPRQPALPGMDRKSASQSPVGLKRGERVRIRVRTGPGAGAYSATVLDQSSESLLVWAWARDWYPDSISLHTAVEVGFASPRGWGQFHSRVTGLSIRDCVIEIMVAGPRRVEYLQRRRQPRFAAVLPIRAWPAGSVDPPAVAISGHTDDIAQRGLRASFRARLTLEGPVVLSVPTEGGAREGRLMAQPVWYQPVGERGPLWHCYGFRFLRLAPEARRYLRALLAQVQSKTEDPGRVGRRGSDAGADSYETRGETADRL
jgi:hypothetical protein